MTEDSDSKDRIIKASLELFSKKGFDGTSMQEIADKAEISKPVIYYFFKSKDGLNESIWLTISSEFFRQLEKLSVYEPHPTEYEKDMFPQLCAIADLYVTFAQTQPLFFRYAGAAQLMPSSANGSIAAGNYFKFQYEKLNNFFVSAAEKHGSLKGKESRLAKTFLVFVYGMMTDKIDTKDFVKQFLYGIYA